MIEGRVLNADNDEPETEIDESEVLDPNRFETTNTNTFAGVNLDHNLTEGLSYKAGSIYQHSW